MATNVYSAEVLIGGGTGALDAIDGTALANLDWAIVAVQGESVYHYVLNATSGVAESSPNIISPDSNAGNKRWILHDSVPVATGSGSIVRATSPALVTPLLGTPTSGTLTNCTGLPGTGVLALSNRNAIINGAMDIWQRGTTTLTDPATATYFPDRFKTVHVLGDGTFNLLQNAETPAAGFPFQFSLMHDCTHIETAVAAGEYATIQYMVEGYDFKRFEGDVATLSFWAKAVKAGIYCVSLQNSAANKSYVHEFTLAANTWTRVTVTLTFNSGGTFLYTTGIGLRISWAVMAGSTFQTATANKDTWQAGNFFSTDAQVNGLDNTANNFWLIGVQLELGSAATPFEQRLIAQEKALCERYYERKCTDVDFEIFMWGVAASTILAQGWFPFKTPKRVIPSVTVTSVAGFCLAAPGEAPINATNITFGRISTWGVSEVALTTSGLTAGKTYFVAPQSASGNYMEISVEL